MTFDSIATNLLKVNGYEVLSCNSDAEAIEKSEDLKNGSNQYPVYFSASNTSGEKAFEEFFTQNEKTDMGRFKALGVITDKPLTDRKKVEVLFNNLINAFSAQKPSKTAVVKVIKEYLPNFEHIEMGKSLDSKM